MIFTYSVIAGFRAILGSVGVQLAMALAIIMFLEAPEQPYGAGGNAEDNEILQDKLANQKLYMIITHLFAAASMFLSQFAPSTWLSAMSITTIVAMGLQVMNIISICDFLFLKFEIATNDTAKGAEMDKEFYEFKIWL